MWGIRRYRVNEFPGACTINKLLLSQPVWHPTLFLGFNAHYHHHRHPPQAEGSQGTSLWFWIPPWPHLPYQDNIVWRLALTPWWTHANTLILIKSGWTKLQGQLWRESEVLKGQYIIRDVGGREIHSCSLGLVGRSNIFYFYFLMNMGLRSKICQDFSYCSF